MTKDGTTTTDKGKWHSLLRPSRGSLLLAMLIVLPPWILVAVPGDDLDHRDIPVLSVHHHGWPLTHQRTSKVRVSQKELLEVSNQGLAVELDPSRMAQLFLQGATSQRAGPFDSASQRYRTLAYTRWATDEPVRFWSDIRNWPIQESATAMASELSWLALVGNLAVLLILIWLVALLIARRSRRRKRWFTFSLFELAIVLPLLGVAIAVLVAEQRRATKEAKQVRMLLDSSQGSLLEIKSGPSIPRFVFDLLDHRVCLPGNSVPLFAPIDYVYCKPSTLNPKELGEIVFPVGWDLRLPHVEDFNVLQSIDRTTTERLVIHMKPAAGVFLDEYESTKRIQLAHKDPEAYWDKVLPIPNDFPNLKRLEVILAPDSQGAQLERLSKINSFSQLSLLVLDGLEESGKALSLIHI